MNRRHFIQGAVATVAGLACRRTLAAELGGEGVSLVVDPRDPVASSAAAGWAVGELKSAIEAGGSVARVVSQPGEAPPADACVVVAGLRSPLAREALARLGVAPIAEPESLGLARSAIAGRPVVLAAGNDPLGLVYALTELADRIRCLDTAQGGLELAEPALERPASRVRSVTRPFSSEVEDKSWFYDRDFWRRYLTTLATHRFNRFSFATGMGYNSAIDVTDGYFVFPYPFLVDVPGYRVRVRGLSAAEQARNLDTLKFIAAETARRGLQFQLAVWTHAYRWPKSPNATCTIEGLTDDTQGPYCRDALAMVLRECPEIGGLTFRVHSESGVPEGHFDFWKTVFDGAVRSGRRVEIDLHAKNVPNETLEVALATGLPVALSPKYCGEHVGLPYPPASIREFEMADPGSFTDTGGGLSRGSRRFSRYGYADFFAADRRYDVLFRIWPGTQRLLLGGDPATAAGFGRSASFCGAMGIELCDPLTFKGRMGSGLPGGRCGYADPSLNPRYDFEKYLYFYRVWGRLNYHPETKPEVWRRYLRREFGEAAPPLERTLASAARVLPLITLAHAPSADCTLYWPEIYANLPIVDAGREQPYTDCLPPKLFGHASSFDPQLFDSPDACADALLAGRATAKYSPLEVADWLEAMAGEIETGLAEARSKAGAERSRAEFRRAEEDALILRGLALFFRGKFRSAVLRRIGTTRGSRRAGEEALRAHRAAREAWRSMAARAGRIYRSDLSFGDRPTIRGHWLDRLPAIDQDQADMQDWLERMGPPASSGAEPESVASAIAAAMSRPRRPKVNAAHSPAKTFAPGAALSVELRCAPGAARSVLLHYRHVNQAERWQASEMNAEAADAFAGVIPASYTAHRYSLQYYFEIRTGRGAALFPALDRELANMPYFVVSHPGRWA